MTNRIMKQIRTLTIVAIALSAATLAQAGSFKIIANSSVRASSVSKKTASDMFMKRAGKWDDGSTVVPVDQADVTSVRDDFSRAIHGKPTAAVKSYWNQQIFSGREVPPVEKGSDADVLAFVRSTPGAIGYISDTAAADGVHVLRVE
jgi:ABC-type phosphate transport system substrate-binding protein